MANATGAEDQYELKRFVEAQEEVYARALAEIKRGRKQSHWMWFIFPQIEGLGSSATARFYSIKSRQEAKAYLDHPVLGQRLIECSEVLLRLKGKSASEIFGYPDDMKLRSSMTLFATVSPADSVCHRVVDQYFGGNMDQKTLDILKEQSAS